MNTHTAYDIAHRAGRRVFYEAATETIRQCPENYMLAHRVNGTWCPDPDKASTINAHSLGLVLGNEACGLDNEALADEIELCFWGSLGSKRSIPAETKSL